MDGIAPLFDAYRQFYGKPSDLASATRFLAERLGRGESIVLFATDAGPRDAVAGFAQLYPTFSSLMLAPAIVLNDLFVRPEARRRGIARALLDATRAHALSVGAGCVSLATQVSNEEARALYRQAGYVHETGFDHLTLVLSGG